ncbi:MAG: serine/threonine protein kinase [Planctomycetes bacterium]|nr:serine/threonine protein kinase [Planctomycetota bacterium]
MSPALSSRDRAPDARARGIVEDFLGRRREGEFLSTTTILAQHPDLRADLEDSFRALAAIEQRSDSAFNTVPWPPSGDTPSADGSQDTASFLARPGGLRFEVQSCLGTGGFGVVYLAHDRLLDRQVALKIPKKTSFPTPEHRTQFLREARLSAKLRHPSIVAVYDVCEENGVLLMVMEYIAGRSLRDMMAEGPLPALDAAQLMERIADATAYANQHGLVHRDLKPSNILLDGENKPHVADFGLAVQEEAMRMANRDSAGTPSYMAPEQVRGETCRLDGRTDLWSLGVILYEMLTGRRPFVGGDRDELFYRILHQEPKPPRQVRPQIPPELERICLRCLAKQTSDRYSTVADLVSELREWRESATVGASDPRPGILRYWPLGAAAVLLAATGLGFWAAAEGVVATSSPTRSAPDAAAAFALPEPVITSVPFAEIPPDQREPLHWYSLLEHPPQRLLWPRDFDLSPAPLHDRNAERLIAMSRGEALLSFGELHNCDFTFEVEIQQTQWTGGVGVFFGGKMDEATGDVREYQRLFLLRTHANDKKSPFAWVRSIVDKPPPGGGLAMTWDVFGSDRIFTPPPNPHLLRITVKNGRLMAATFGGTRLPNVCQATPGRRAAASDPFGHFGLYINQGECAFSRARVILDTRG